MQTILVANPKGGSGKTTLATNVAGWLAGKRQRVALADHDPQRSATRVARATAGAVSDDRRARGRCDEESAEGRRSAVARRRHARGAARRGRCAMRCATPTSCWCRCRRRRSTWRRPQHFLAAIARLQGGEGGRHRDRHRRRCASMRAPAARPSSTSSWKASTFPLVTHLRDTQVYVYCARDGRFGVRPAALARRAGLGAVEAADALDRAARRGAEVRLTRPASPQSSRPRDSRRSCLRRDARATSSAPSRPSAPSTAFVGGVLGRVGGLVGGVLRRSAAASRGGILGGVGGLVGGILGGGGGLDRRTSLAARSLSAASLACRRRRSA